MQLKSTLLTRFTADIISQFNCTRFFVIFFGHKDNNVFAYKQKKSTESQTHGSNEIPMLKATDWLIDCLTARQHTIVNLFQLWGRNTGSGS